MKKRTSVMIAVLLLLLALVGVLFLIIYVFGVSITGSSLLVVQNLGGSGSGSGSSSVNFASKSLSCSSGACCDTRINRVKIDGAQPTGKDDEYYCSGDNSATGKNYVKKKDYYCNGLDSVAHTKTSTKDTCGTCEKCEEDGDDAECVSYSDGTVIGDEDCSSLNSVCRTYQDVPLTCGGGDITCTNYTNTVAGTSCGVDMVCDGNGTCINDTVICITHFSEGCYNDNVYWFDSCSNREEISETCSESTTYSYFCDASGDVALTTSEFAGSCGAGSCSSTLVSETTTVVQDCLYGCTNAVCDSEPCVDACIIGEQRCNGGTLQTCGNYDSDSCTEWPATTSGSGNYNCPFGCVGDACLITCSVDSDCGTDGFIGSTYCEAITRDVYQDYRYFDCLLAGGDDSSCSSTTESRFVEDCGISEYSSNYCASDGNVYRDFTDRGCAAGGCTEIVTQELVNDCGAAGCSASSASCNPTTTVVIPAGKSIFSLPRRVASGVAFNEMDNNCTLLQYTQDCDPDNDLAYWNPLTEGYECISANDNLYAGQGYFIRTAATCQVQVYGDNFEFDDGYIGQEGSGILYSGFNLIGAASSLTAFFAGTCDVVRNPSAMIYGVTSCDGFHDYNGGYESCRKDALGINYCYCETSAIRPGKGYFLFVDGGACSLI